jgi:hypothetical protein
MIRFIAFFASVFILIALLVLPTNAQENLQDPELILTWQTDSLNSSGYIGKSLAGQGSTFTLMLEVLDSTKTANLDEYEVRWYLNGSLISSGLGLTQINLTPSSLVSSMKIKVEIVRYAGAGNVSKSTTIEMAEPKLIISGPAHILAKSTPTFRAFYYFIPRAPGLGDAELFWAIGGGRETSSLIDDNLLNIDLSGLTDETNLRIRARLSGSNFKKDLSNIKTVKIN